MGATPLAVLEAMNTGQPVTRKELDAAIRVLEDMLPEAREKGPPGYAARIQDSIQRVRAYKALRGIKSRSFGEIQSDIDRAQQMVNDYRIHRKYELAARWERNRDEYSNEYREALLGRTYIPKIEEADINVAKTWVPEGFQLSM